MARCRYCEKSGIAVRTNDYGVCRPCSKVIRQDVARKLAEVKEALVYIRCSKDPRVQESFCDVAADSVAKLATYEKRRLAEISPSPAALLAMLRSKRQEASAAAGDKPEVVRPVKGGSAYLAQIVEPPQDETAETPLEGTVEDSGDWDGQVRVAAHPGEQAWWAWEPEPATSAASADAREETRLAVDCLALVDPGAIRGTLQNISPGGLFLQSATLHPPGRPVDLIISTASGPAKAHGIVRWVQADTLSGASAGMGIEFTEVTEELQSYLSGRLGGALPAGPWDEAPAQPSPPAATP